jgi:hypothetical protein
MTKLEILKANYKNSTIEPDKENPELYYLDKGTKNALLFRVLTGEESYKEVQREIKAGLSFFEPEVLSAYMDNKNFKEDLFIELRQAFDDGHLSSLSALLYGILEKCPFGFRGFINTMISRYGSGYFLGSFENREIALGGGFFAYRID